MTQAASTDATPPFPTSSWWARIILSIAGLGGVLALALIGVALAVSLTVFLVAVARGASGTLPKVETDLATVLPSVLSIFCAYGLIRRLRKPWVYYTSAVCLGWFTITAAGAAEILTIGDLPSVYGRVIATALMGLLFVRFTFGRPSRRYYRVAKAHAAAPPPLPADTQNPSSTVN